jgi:hypothetical protein
MDDGELVANLKRFPQRTTLRLHWAGWRRGRHIWDRLALPPSFDVFPAAQRVLTEFGGLIFKSASGYAKLDPMVGEEIAAEIQKYAAKLSRRLYPIGIVEGGDTIYILIDERGVIYMLAGWLEPLASSFDRAIQYLAEVCAVNEAEKLQDLKTSGLLGLAWRIDEI